ncbi:hypothetical protein G6F35_004473 [Rhizopus arrhizus]|nr:hypothetical protein G6F35_004473 [Rhizopus arrhizus]
MLQKEGQKRKRSRSGSRGVDTKDDLNYVDEESELSSGDLSSSDLDLTHDFTTYTPRKRGRPKVQEKAAQNDISPPIAINNGSGYVSEIDESGETKIDKFGRLLGVKVHINNVEKGYLVDSRQLRSSFRTREISVVTARSVFKQFGHRIIRKGRKGRDDYFYTEEADEPEEDILSDDGMKRPNENNINNRLISANTTITQTNINSFVYSTKQQINI